MSSKELADRLSAALENSRLVSPVHSSFGDDRVAILCRVSKDNEADWNNLITKVLIGSNLSLKKDIRWQCHICRHYFLKEVDGEDKLVWGWNFSIHSREILSAVDSVIRLIKGQSIDEYKYPGEITEFPLRLPKKQGKGGVYTIGGSADADFNIKTSITGKK